jgi:beta-glucosidase
MKYPFQDPDLSEEKRVEDLVSRMTLEEKISCLSTNPSVPRLGVKAGSHVEGLHGLAMGEPGDWGRGYPVPTTQFPQAYGMGESWDPDLVRQAGRIEGIETRYMYQSPKYQRGSLVVRAPNADIGRDPRWGRTEECFGEDPFFNGTMAAAMTRGLQGDDKRCWLTASLLKHFLANSNENDRSSSSSDFDQRLFHEYYAVAFREAVKAGSRCLMAAYNAWNRIPCHVHPMLRGVLMGMWGVDGIICTDGGGLKLLVSQHKYYEDLETAASECIRAGINQFLDRHQDAVRNAVKSGFLKETEIDEVIKGCFRVAIRLGQLDPEDRVPYAKIGSEDRDPWESEEHMKVCRELTDKSVVLLKNENGLLPIDPKRVKSLAVLGNRADEVLLDWYSGTPPYTVSALDGIRERAGKSIRVEYSRASTAAEIEDAERLAAGSDLVVLCLGNHPTGGTKFGEPCPRPSDGKEAIDRQEIRLEDEELVRRIYKVNRNIVLVLISSFPFAIVWSQKHLPAIVHMANNSQELGHSLAAALWGDINPAGRLVQTWVRTLEHLPPMMDYDIRNGRTHMYFNGEPLFPFGFGLSYTEFAYSGLSVDRSELPTAGVLKVSFDVKNTGKRDGDEVCQMYVRHIGSSVERPKKELRGFRRITLKPGQTERVVFELPAEKLAYWDTERSSFRVEKDRIRILVGASSSDIRLESGEVPIV